ncbi:hypothetical protein Tco_1180039 [Tanacetum coccineum]
MDELAIRPGQYFVLTLVRRGKFSLTACENYASYLLRNSNCHIGQEPDYNLERMGWYYNWRWYTNHGDERGAFYIKLTSDVLILGRIRISKGFVDGHKLRGYVSAVVSHMDKKFEFKLCKKTKSVEMFSTTTLRDMVRSGFWRSQWVWFYLSNDTSLEDGAYALKFADDVLLGIFMNVPTVILVFWVTGSACSLIHATAWIQAWGKPVWTDVDDVLLLALMLKHVIPSLLSQLVVLLSFNSVSGQHVRCFHASAWIQDSGATCAAGERITCNTLIFLISAEGSFGVLRLNTLTQA